VLKRIAIAIPTILMLLGVSATIAASGDVTAQGGLTMTVRAGYDGYYKPGNWVPVHIVIANGGGEIDGEVQVTTANNWRGTIYAQPAILATQSRKQFTLHVYVPQNVRMLYVRLLDGTETRASKQVASQPVNNDDFLYGVVSDDVAALSYLAGLPPRGGNKRVNVAHLGLMDLPTQGRALSGLDMIILHNVDTGTLTDEQRTALRGWVAMGGHLFICGGPQATRTAAGLDDLLPVSIHGTETTADLGALGDYVSAPFIAGVPAVVAQVAPSTPGATILAGTADRPLLVRRKLDFGQIDYLALDPDLEPMRTWIGTDDFWLRTTSSTVFSEPSLSETIWNNLSSALSNIPNLGLPSSWLVIGFLFAYVIVVGPLNLLVLKLVDKRALAWITVPVLILLFSCVAYLTGYVSRGRRVIVNDISILRGRPESGTAIVESYVGLYSPARRAYDVHLTDNVLVHRLAPPFYGGYDPSSEEMTVELGPPTYIQGIEVDVGAMKSFATHAIQPWDDIEANLTLTPAGNIYHIEGTITNKGDAALTGCALLYQLRPVQIPDIGPGETAEVSVDIAYRTNISAYSLADELLDDTALTAKQRRERERKQDILQGIFQYSMSGPWSSRMEMAGIVLLGWTSESALPVEVSRAASTTYATTLMLVPLRTTTGDPNLMILPLRSLNWRVTASSTALSPYNLQRNTGNASFVFQLPDNARGMRVQKLTLHLDRLVSSSSGTRPSIMIRNVDTDVWETIQAVWGENEIVGPEHYINEDGEIAIRVNTSNINAPLSVDFTVTLGKGL
jgi:hypothetical protein